MKKYIKYCYLLLAFMFFGHISYAQCLIANVNIADCSSCYNGITLLNNDSIQIPKFVVFKESFRADSLEIEKRFKFGQLGFNMLFNNLLYERVQSDNIRSSLTYLDENLEMKWKFDLKFITQETITDSILSISLPINEEDQLLVSYSKNYIYKFNYGLGSLKIYDRTNKLINTINSSDFPYMRLLTKLNEYEKSMMIARDSIGIKMNKEGIGIGSKYKWHREDEFGNIYMIFNYSTLSDTVQLKGASKNCYVKFNPNGEIIDLYPIIEQDEFSIFDNSFMLKDSSTFYVITHDWRDWINKKAPRGETVFLFITKYSLQGDSFIFSGQVPYLLPKIYASKYFENILSSGTSFYPIVALPLSNELYNIENKKIAYLINDSIFNTKVVYDGNISKPLDEPIIVNKSIMTDKNEYYIAFKYEKNWHFNLYNADLELLKSKRLDYLSKYINATYVSIDIYDRIIIFHEISPGSNLILPLDVVL